MENILKFLDSMEFLEKIQEIKYTLESLETSYDIASNVHHAQYVPFYGTSITEVTHFCVCKSTLKRVRIVVSKWTSMFRHYLVLSKPE